MYLDPKTLAYIQLNAVLTSLVPLCEMDEQAKQVIRDKNISITFNILKGPKLTLSFKNGQCQALPNVKNGDLQLWFRSFAHFNAVMADRAKPIVLWGFHKLSFLTSEFKLLTKRLELFLKPDETSLANSEFMRINTLLMARLAVKASIEVGNHDPQMMQIRKSFPKGVMCFGIQDSIELFIENKDGWLSLKNKAKEARANITFKDLGAACLLFNGQIDSFSSVAQGKLNVSGYIPMLDHFDKYLYKVNYYLK